MRMTVVLVLSACYNHPAEVAMLHTPMKVARAAASCCSLVTDARRWVDR